MKIIQCFLFFEKLSSDFWEKYGNIICKYMVIDWEGIKCQIDCLL